MFPPPSNLDEAAGNYAIEVVPDKFVPDEGKGYKAAYTLPDIKAAFKAGAEWMAGQGGSFENSVFLFQEHPMLDGLVRDCVSALEKAEAKSGDKVIVQIRKK